MFYLPEHDRVRDAFARLDVAVRTDRLDEAHYHGVAALEQFRDDETTIWHAYNRAYAHACGVDADDADRAVAVLLEEFGRGGIWTRIIPGARDALAALRDRGFGLAVVSNADGTAEEQLRRDAICQVGPGPGVEVHAVLDSTVVGIAKPDPGIFWLALDTLGVTPDETIHVGDTPAADVAGARAAGVAPVLVDPFDLHPEADCVRVAALDEVPALLAAWS